MKSATGRKTQRFSLTQGDEALEALVRATDRKTLAIWAADCAGRVLPFFEEQYPEDPRPRSALETCRAWIQTGVFHMAVIRTASLSAHASARGAGEDTAARSAARAAGQAVATAHVPAHAPGAARYALQAVGRAHPADPGAARARERDWQYRHLLALREEAGAG